VAFLLRQVSWRVPVGATLLQDEVVHALDQDFELEIDLLQVPLEVLQLSRRDHHVAVLVRGRLPPEGRQGQGGLILRVVVIVVACGVLKSVRISENGCLVELGWLIMI